MIRKIIWIIILFSLVGALAYGQANYPGIVQIEWLSYSSTLSIYLFALLSLFGLITCFWLWRLYRGMMALPNRFKGWRNDKREQRALAALQTATIALQEGRFAHAEKAAKIAARQPSATGLAAILGAASAHARKDHNSANEWLNQLDAHPEFADSKILQQTRMSLDNGEPLKALSLLDGVSPNLRKHSTLYKELLIQSQAQSNNWHEVKQLATERKTTITAEQKSEWMKRAISRLSTDENLSTDYLRTLYKDMPDNVRNDDDSIKTLTHAFIERKAYLDARIVIQESMRHHWRPNLLPDYVRAATVDSITDQLKMCNAWQNQGHNDVALHTTAGQLCIQSQVWGQAKKHFEEAIKLQPSATVYSGLAQALHAIGDKEGAQNAEHQASLFNEVKILTS